MANYLDFFKHDAGGGIVLILTAICALVIANSALAPTYFSALDFHIGGLSILHWVNDGLMALFFLLVAMEIKREFLDGQLSTWPRRVLPGIAALGGMAVPAGIYVLFNRGGSIEGWAVPTATDIAFALGFLALLGSRVPTSLKIFLTALAIIDDLGAVLIIALFYTAHISLIWMGATVALIALLTGLNRAGVERLCFYLPLGGLLWFCMLQSGIHASLAGVALALTIPLKPLHALEHKIHPWVTFLVLPIFGFANAGVNIGNVSGATLMQPVTFGIIAGLFLGKALGVFLTSYAAIKFKWASSPENASTPQLFGLSILCGIGFTMSLFIGLLAFPSSPDLQEAVKVGVLAGSALSALIGTGILFMSGRKA